MRGASSARLAQRWEHPGRLNPAATLPNVASGGVLVAIVSREPALSSRPFFLRTLSSTYVAYLWHEASEGKHNRGPEPSQPRT
jgi:hypothetical protein